MAGNFVMNTAGYCEIWKNHLRKSGADDWRRFVLTCFKRFTDGTQVGNLLVVKASDAKWKSWTEDKQYTFLSDRCYSKCIGIQRKLKNKESLSIDLPQGYKDRNGKSTKRLSTKDLADIFRG